MRVLHVISDMDPQKGGVSQAVRTIIGGLSMMGIYNEVVSLDDKESAFLGNDNFILHALGAAKGPWSYNAALVPWLKKNMERFDTIIIHGLWLFHGYAAFKALKAIKKKLHIKSSGSFQLPKLFVMPHGMLDPYFQRATGRKIKAVRNKVYWQLIEKKLINQSSGLLFTSQTELQLAREPFKPYKPKLETVVGLGVERPPFYTSIMRDAFINKCPGLENQSYFLFLSRIHEKKGVDMLIQAYNGYLKIKHNEQLTSQEKIDIPKLVIAGPGVESAYGVQMQKLSFDSLKLNGMVYFPGMLTGAAKWGAFYGCQAFVLPSHQENFGIAVVESLACSKAVLISNQVNIWREIESMHSGIVVNDDLDGTFELFTHWDKLSENEKVEMGINAKRAYESLFTVESVMERFSAALKAV